VTRDQNPDPAFATARATAEMAAAPTELAEKPAALAMASGSLDGPTRPSHCGHPR
jgi:hypothetical protein